MELKSLTTMKIGGAPEQLIRLKELHDLKGSLKAPIRILGNGSNVLVDDRGLKGTVICVRDFPPSEPEVISEDAQSVLIRVSAGAFLPALSRWAQKKGFSGFEYLIGVPGTLGGAIVQNAGANEQEISDVIQSAQIFDLKTHQLQSFEASALQLTYRHSFLKAHPEYLVVDGIFKLSKQRSLQEIEDRMNRNQTYRREKTPFNKPSLGSVFTRLSDGRGGWLFPGKLIEDVGLKGHQVGGAKISEIHANYIVNEGSATFDDVMTLIELIEAKVFERLGVRMQREILIWSDR